MLKNIEKCKNFWHGNGCLLVERISHWWLGYSTSFVLRSVMIFQWVLVAKKQNRTKRKWGLQQPGWIIGQKKNREFGKTIEHENAEEQLNSAESKGDELLLESILDPDKERRGEDIIIVIGWILVIPSKSPTTLANFLKYRYAHFAWHIDIFWQMTSVRVLQH